MSKPQVRKHRPRGPEPIARCSACDGPVDLTTYQQAIARGTRYIHECGRVIFGSHLHEEEDSGQAPEGQGTT